MMTDATTEPAVQLSRRNTTLNEQLQGLWEYRRLALALAGRDVRSRHKSSVLGFTWNLLNPLLQMLIYTLVFTVIMSSGVPDFPLKLLSGSAIFGLFTASVNGGVTSITGGGSALVTKIWFPREVLPVANVIANLVTFGSRLSILVVALLLYRHPPAWELMWLAFLAVIVATVLATGVAVLLSALNVFFRDVQHFTELALMALFWFTPVVWSYSLIATKINGLLGPGWERIAMLNPLVGVVTVFERVMYNPAAFPPEEQAQSAALLRPTSWHLQNLGISLAIGLVILYVGLRVFSRLQGSFAENL